MITIPSQRFDREEANKDGKKNVASIQDFQSDFFLPKKGQNVEFYDIKDEELSNIIECKLSSLQ